MYGLIGHMDAHPGRRDELVALLVDEVGAMTGCFSYVVATDPSSADRIWVTEVWESEESHHRSLQDSKVRATIERAMPLIATFGDGVTTTPVGGHGLG